METIPARREHIPLIEEAFARQRESRAREFIDYLALPGIADFHSDRLCESIRKNTTPPFSLFFHNGKLAALYAVEKSQWHSQHYGFPYLKMQPFYCFATEDLVIHDVVRTVVKTFTQTGGTVYTTRIDGHAAALAYFLDLERFTQVGTSVRMIIHSKNYKSIDNLSLPQYDSLHIRDYKDSDLERLQQIGGQNHGHSHFFRELRFPLPRTQALFAEWVQKCAKGVAQRILVAEWQGQTVGFSTLLTNDSLVPYIGQRIGIVDFIVVDSQVQGKGISARLLHAGLAWFFQTVDFVELRTMAENWRAIRFYERNGFQILSSDHHYHYWT